MRTRTFAALAATLAGGATAVVLAETAGGVTAAHEYGHILNVVLSGRGGGDTNGFGSFNAVLAGRKVCFGMETVGIAPLAAHIHKGAAGTDGPIVVTLKHDNVKASAPTVGGGCATVSKSLADDLVKRPKGYYVNVHTEDFPSGAIRGQLAHPPKG